MKSIRSRTYPCLLATAVTLSSLYATEPAFHEPPLPNIPRHIFNVTKFGAKGDGVTG